MKQLGGKKYFYALGQWARSKGLTKDQGMSVLGLTEGTYASIAYDKGYRGLSTKG